MSNTRNGTHQVAAGRARVRSAARSLNHAVVDAGSRAVRAHPWVLTSAGFCAGLALPLLFRAPARGRAPAGDGGDDLRGVWSEARSIALEAVACALAVSVDHLLGGKKPEADDC